MKAASFCGFLVYNLKFLLNCEPRIAGAIGRALVNELQVSSLSAVHRLPNGTCGKFTSLQFLEGETWPRITYHKLDLVINFITLNNNFATGGRVSDGVIQ